MSRKYKFHNASAAYFVSFATVYWIDVFTREIYCKVLADSLSYCRAHRGMSLFAYCFMPNHVHFIFRAEQEDPTSLLSAYKRHTAKKILEAIKENPQESRREWLFEMFERAGKKKRNVAKYQFWQHNNQPIELWSTAVIKQKLNYIHNNPVQAGFVSEPAHWKWSSARNIEDKNSEFDVDEIGFLY